MLKDIKGAIFDLDGTLVDSMWIWKDIDVQYLGSFGIELPPNLQREIEGMSFTETACYFKSHFSISDSVEEIKKTWNQMAWEFYRTRVTMKAGAVDFLQELQKKGIALGIATSNSREITEMITEVHGIRSYFSAIVTGCDVAAGKPSPDVYLRAAEQLHVEPEKCIVFEDIPKGILAGKSAGMKVCAVEDLYSFYAEEEKRKLADYYIRDFHELMSAL